eukprot:m.4674 g.4674  ORF g.4674 m.4674 type:complete len:86 (+) comp2273_c0_seq1:296-553(+)
MGKEYHGGICTHTTDVLLFDDFSSTRDNVDFFGSQLFPPTKTGDMERELFSEGTHSMLVWLLIVGMGEYTFPGSLLLCLLVFIIS